MFSIGIRFFFNFFISILLVLNYDILCYFLLHWSKIRKENKVIILLREEKGVEIRWRWRRKERRRRRRRRKRRSTNKYKGRTDSNSPTGPNEAVCLATLLLL